MPKRKPSWAVLSEPRADKLLSVVYCNPSAREVVLSTGVVLFARYEKLLTLCVMVCQEQAAITIRTWETADGEELVELHRITSTTALQTGSTSSEVF